MPINPNIALGAQQQQQPVNMLGQMGQLYALKAAKQEVEGSEALRDAFASGGDLNDPAFIQRLRAANPKMALELEAKNLAGEKVRGEILSNAYKNSREALGLVNSPESLRAYSLSQFSDPVIGPKLKAIGLTPEIAIANLDKEIATSGFETALRKASMGLERFFGDQTTRRGQDLSHSAAMAGVGATIRGQDLTDKRLREQLHTIETEAGPGVYQQFGPNAGVIRPMTQTPWSPPGATATPPAPPVNVGGGALGSGTFNPTAPIATTTGAAPSVNALAPNLTGAPTVNNLMQQQQGAGGYTQARPKGPSSITTVNAYVPASEAAQGEYIKSTRATFDQLKHAPTVLDNIEKAKALIPTAKGFMGTGGETMLEAAKFMNNRLGTSIDTAGIKSAEELNSRLFMGIMDNLKKMDAQPSQQQQAAMKQALGSIGTDPNAMGAVLDVFGDIVRGKVDIHNQEVIDAEARGTKFPYNPVIKLPPKTANIALPPIYATNGKERRVSTDGGITWNPVGAK